VTRLKNLAAKGASWHFEKFKIISRKTASNGAI
jgi:hypothetical protein